MRIGIDARFLGAGHARSGPARYAERLLQALARRDAPHEFTVFIGGPLDRRLKLDDRFRVVTIHGHPWSLRTLARLGRVARRERLDLLHALSPLAPPWLDIPTLLTVHDIVPYSPASVGLSPGRRARRALWTHALFPAALRRAKWAVCVSEATRRHLVRRFPEAAPKALVVYSAAPERFETPPEPVTLALVRRRLELPEDYLLYSGSIRADKNVPGMLALFAALRQRFPKRYETLHFVLDVGGVDRHRLNAVYEAIRRLDLTDRVRILRGAADEQRQRVFLDARALIMLSAHEGFGFPALEAQLSGLPILASGSGALPEIVGERGAVYVADDDDEHETVALLDRLLTDEALRAYLIEHGRANARRFSWDRTADRIGQIYDLLFYRRDLIRRPDRHRLLNRMTEWVRC